MRSDGALSSATARRLAAGRPSIAHVGSLLLVPFAVRELDRHRAVRFVEVARALVLLEDPELEAVGSPRLYVLEQCVADAGADCVRVDVEMGEPIAVERGETAAEDVDLAVPHATAEEREMLVVRVELR